MRSPFREMAKLAALTLMRLSEIRLLRREMVHLEQGVVLLPQAKSGARPVVLGQDAQKVLRGPLEAHDKAWVFPNPDGSPFSRHYVSHVFRKAARSGGLKDFPFQTSAITGRRWPSMRGSRRPSPRRSAGGKRSV
jgi:integrase